MKKNETKIEIFAEKMNLFLYDLFENISIIADKSFTHFHLFPYL